VGDLRSVAVYSTSGLEAGTRRPKTPKSRTGARKRARSSGRRELGIREQGRPPPASSRAGGRSAETGGVSILSQSNTTGLSASRADRWASSTAAGGLLGDLAAASTATRGCRPICGASLVGPTRRRDARVAIGRQRSTARWIFTDSFAAGPNDPNGTNRPIAGGTFAGGTLTPRRARTCRIRPAKVGAKIGGVVLCARINRLFGLDSPRSATASFARDQPRFAT